MLVRQKRNNFDKKLKRSGLETGAVNFRVAKTHLQKIMFKKKNSYFEEKVD